MRSASDEGGKQEQEERDDDDDDDDAVRKWSHCFQYSVAHSSSNNSIIVGVTQQQ